MQYLVGSSPSDYLFFVEAVIYFCMAQMCSRWQILSEAYQTGWAATFSSRKSRKTATRFDALSSSG